VQTFKVSPGAVRAYGDVITRQADHTGSAIQYLGKHTAIDDGAVSDLAFLATAQAHHPTVVATVRDAIARSTTFFIASGGALKASADYYENTDHDAAAALDATYTAAADYDVLYVQAPDYSHTPAEQTDPSAVLTEPAYDPGAFDPNPFGVLSDWNNLFSPAVWVNTAVKEIVGWDPLDSAQKHLAGDWTAFAKAGAAFKVLAECYHHLAINTAEYGQLPKVWQGEALDLAYAYFAVGTAKLYSLPVDVACNPAGGDHIYEAPYFRNYYEQLTLLSTEYYALAQGMSELANTVTGLIGSLFDYAFWIGVGAGVTAATSEFVVPALISGAITAGMVASAIDKATAITGALEMGTFLVNGFTGVDAQGQGFQAACAIAELTMPTPGREWLV
jgi:hypothetical protein